MPIEAAFDDEDVVADEQESCGEYSYDDDGYDGKTCACRMRMRVKN